MFRAWTKDKQRKGCFRTNGFFCLFVLCLLLTACGGGIYHTVKPGQTLYRISRTYGVSEATIARANSISDPSRVRAGTRLFIPEADRLRTVPVVKSKPRKPPAKSVTATPKTTSTKTVKSAPVAKPATTVSQARSKASSKSTEVKKLQWPLRGKIVRSYSPKAKAGSGKGIEIAVRSGTSVLAAEAGKVIYSGDGVQGYGHLIILQHENNLFTVYGFNQRNLARQGDFVSKGEKIALSGSPPSGGTPRMHFEVRKGKQAVNPILYLP